MSTSVLLVPMIAILMLCVLTLQEASHVPVILVTRATEKPPARDVPMTTSVLIILTTAILMLSVQMQLVSVFLGF